MQAQSTKNSEEDRQNKVTVILSVSGMLGQPNAQIKRFYMNRYLPLSKVQFDLFGNCEFILEPPIKSGFYRINVKGYNSIDFVIGPKDKIVKIDALIPEEEIRVSNIISTENHLYRNLMMLVYQNQYTLDSLGAIREDISKVNKQYYHLKASAKRKTEEALERYYKRIDKLVDANPETYVAEVLGKIYRNSTRIETPETEAEYDSHESWYHYNFFRNMDLNDPRILTTPAFFAELSGYLENYKGEFDADYKRSVDILLKGTNNEEVRSFLADHLLDYYVKLGNQATVNHILDNYSNGCNDDLREALMNDLQAWQGLSEGDKAGELKFKSPNDVTLSLMETYAQNQLTLLVFWKSTCEFCKVELGAMKSLYKTYHKLGLEIYGVSIDKNHSQWATTVSQRNYTWPNVIADANISEISKAYGVKYTPTVYLLDGKGKVLASNLRGRALETLISNQLSLSP